MAHWCRGCSTFTFGTTVDDQQVGCLWQGRHRLSVSLSGAINYLDEGNPARPGRVIHGHSKAITASAVGPSRTFFAGDGGGRVVAWALDSGSGTPLQGPAHTNQVCGLAMAGDVTLLSAGLDDAVRFTPVATQTTGSDAVQSPAQPRALAAHSSGVAVLVTLDHVHVLVDGKVAGGVKTNAFAAALAPSGTEVAVGEADAVQFYTLADGALTPTARVTEGVRGQVVALAYAPDGSHVAAGDTMRQVTIIDAASKKVRRPWHSCTCAWPRPCVRTHVDAHISMNMYLCMCMCGVCQVGRRV
jgi:WD repeat-containing protein 1 (actin-interacting protein 1)